MAIPTGTNVYDAARAHLGDESAQIYTDAILAPYAQNAFREIWRIMASVSVPRVKRVQYYNLAANTSHLWPTTAGISDLAEPAMLEERAPGTTVNITGISGTATPTVTAVAHGLSTGDYAVISGSITGYTGILGRFAVTVLTADTFTLNGAIGAGTWSAGGTVSRSTEGFSELDPVGALTTSATGNASLGQYVWREDQFDFPPCSAIRQLRITYWSSGAMSATAGDSIGIDDSLDYLGVRTAALAAASRGASLRAQELNTQATGNPAGIPNGNGGSLFDFLQQRVKALQVQQYVPPRYGAYPNKDMVYPGWVRVL
jgi:hypothetical protein